MLRILILVDHARSITGPHRNVVTTLNALCRRDDVNLRLLCGGFEESEPFAHSPNLEIRLGYDPHKTSRFFSNVSLIANAARGCDVVYVPSGLKSMLFAQVVRFGKRLVVGPNISPLPIRKADSPGNLELNLLCDSWIEASHARRNHVVKYTRNERVEMIHHAIDTQKWGPDRRDPAVWDRLGVPRDALKIVFVSRKDYHLKGAPQLLEAYENVLGRTSKKLHLVVAGTMSDSTLASMQRVGCASAVGFIGADTLPIVYASADISIIPSSWETFSNTTMESLASGIATIGSRVGGIAEQIVDGESGRLIDLIGEDSLHLPNAPGIIAEALLELIENPDLRQRFGQAARQRIFDCFTEERLAQDLMNVFAGSAETLGAHR